MTARTYWAQLACGEELRYESPTFVPSAGEHVPCRRHGFCQVNRHDAQAGPVRGRRRTLPRRSVEDLRAFLADHPDASTHTLKRHRFTLRLLAEAQATGLLQLDLASGRVRRTALDPERSDP